ncbi:helix-turn-helix transcriptional regulator [Actinacidiphila acidipaludis]|uniref:HTH luxR-type domain-containing protein n=1 Tax=Actinacidiphila acidipaludis TaxID=2873382 RepID=A0ABS7Q9E7_9ACTN|nr:hypothetical protein [Streptomyces acidipaludis]MBY8879785.1 hypothetical protein [Streptomyces acidipaludis]
MRTLLEARALIDSTMSAHRHGAGHAPLATTGTEAGTEGESVARLIGGAARRVTAVLSGDPGQSEAVATGIARLTAGQRRADRGVHPVAIRLLAAPQALETSLVRTVAPKTPHCQVRTVDNELDQILMVDGRTLLVRSDGPPGHEPLVTAIEEPGACRAIELLLIGAWRAGSPLAEQSRPGARLGTQIRTSVLESLYAGRPDAVAADRMDISLRTYRRHVADVMRELGAESRFQAGVRAVELRLLAHV